MIQNLEDNLGKVVLIYALGFRIMLSNARNAQNIFKPFLIFILLEYRYVASLQVLLGTRRRIKIKNHLKSVPQCVTTLAR